MTMFWGAQDGALNNILNCILGFEFDSKIVPFSVSKLIKSLFIFFLLAMETMITERH